MVAEYLAITGVDYFEIAIPTNVILGSIGNMAILIEIATGFSFETTGIVRVQDLLAASAMFAGLMRICKDCLGMIIFGSVVMDV